MARAVIDLSRALGFTCIAEGVESESQRAALDELGCENAQGYLFARPGRATDMAEVLRRLERDPAPTAVAAPVSVPAPAPVPAPTKV